MRPDHHRGLFALAVLCTTDLATGQWVQRTPSVAPSSRSGHVLEYDVLRSRAVLFGGYSIATGTATLLSDTWEWDGNVWVPRTSVNVPPTRIMAAYGYDWLRGRVVIFGGLGNGFLADTWEWDGNVWQQVVTPVAPSARFGAGMAFDSVNGWVLLFGGAASPVSAMADTWSYNGVNWTPLQPAHAPSPRWGHGMTFDLSGASVLVQGGTGSSTPLTSNAETWRWDGSDWNQVAVQPRWLPPAVSKSGLTCSLRGQALLFGGGPPAATGDDTWVLAAGDTWVSDTRTPEPPPRQACRLTFDVQRNRALLFGGLANSSSTEFNDTWEYVFQPVATWHATGAGCPGAAGVPSLRVGNDTRPVLGQTFMVLLQSIPGGAPAALSLGASDTTWSGGALPASLGPIGMPGCSLLVSPDALLTAFAGATRIATWTLALPNAPAFAGTQFFAQGFALDPAANALGAVASNEVALVTGIL